LPTIFSIASDYFQIILTSALPYKDIHISGGFSTLRSTSTIVWTRNGEQLKFCISGIAPEKIPNSKSSFRATLGGLERTVPFPSHFECDNEAVITLNVKSIRLHAEPAQAM
jgi:hypothetical protein